MRWFEIGTDYPPGYLFEAADAPEVTSNSSAAPPSGWAVRHGPAILHMFHNYRNGADNVLLPDGTRGRVDMAIMQRNRGRRPLNDVDRAWTDDRVRVPIRWQHGEVTISATDIVFSDFDFSDAFTPIHDGLRQAILADPWLGQLVTSYEGAIALYDVLGQGTFQSVEGREAGFTFDDAAHIVAHLRGFGETLYDIRNADIQVNDAYRHLTGQVRSHVSKLTFSEPEPRHIADAEVDTANLDLPAEERRRIAKEMLDGLQQKWRRQPKG